MNNLKKQPSYGSKKARQDEPIEYQILNYLELPEVQNFQIPETARIRNAARTAMDKLLIQNHTLTDDVFEEMWLYLEQNPVFLETIAVVSENAENFDNIHDIITCTSENPLFAEITSHYYEQLISKTRVSPFWLIDVEKALKELNDYLMANRHSSISRYITEVVKNMQDLFNSKMLEACVTQDQTKIESAMRLAINYGFNLDPGLVAVYRDMITAAQEKIALRHISSFPLK